MNESPLPETGEPAPKDRGPWRSTSPPVVLLVDDQALIGEAVRRMVAEEPDIRFHFCRDPAEAQAIARRLRPTVILQDLVMPEIDGLDLVQKFRADPVTRDVPMIVLSSREEPTTKARAFEVGANDYLVKLPDRLELIARIRYHSEAYVRLLQRDDAYRRLEEDVAQAADYVRSLLPERAEGDSLSIDWQFIPSAALGGDTFGYHRLDGHRLAFYLIDVVGHGVGAALLSVSVLNTIRSQSLPETDFEDPGSVLCALNRSFQMEQQGDKYFTAWYGVMDTEAGLVRYSGGGHPPVVYVPAAGETRLLASDGPMVGAFPDLEFETQEDTLAGPGTLFLYSDGVYEVERTDGERWTFDEFLEAVAEVSRGPVRPIDRLTAVIRGLTGREDFEDDYSIMSIRLGSRE